MPRLDPNTPGPGKYDIKYYNIGKHGQKRSLHGRQKNVEEPLNINIKNQHPGPGTYEFTDNINKFGVYRNSVLRNSLAAHWSPSNKRFEDENRHLKFIPGPGTYR